MVQGSGFVSGFREFPGFWGSMVFRQVISFRGKSWVITATIIYVQVASSDEEDTTANEAVDDALAAKSNRMIRRSESRLSVSSDRIAKEINGKLVLCKNYQTNFLVCCSLASDLASVLSWSKNSFGR